MSKTLIFTATYNEKENIKKLLENLNHLLLLDLDILKAVNVKCQAID